MIRFILIAFVLCAVPARAAQTMADFATGTPVSTDYLVGYRPPMGATAEKRFTLTQLNTFFSSNITGITNSQISALAFSKLTGVPTTLSGYGITDAQPIDSDLTYLAGFTPSANVKAILNAADYAAIRTLLGVSTGGGDLVASNNLSDLASASTARTNLGLAIGTNVQAYDADLGSWAGVTRASGFDAFAATPSSANLLALLTTKTGTGSSVFATDPLLLSPNAAMGALAVDVTKKRNTKSISADSTLTFSATPTAGFTFGLVLTNGDSAAHTITIPSSYSQTILATRTAFTIPASSTVELSWTYDGTTYSLAGEPYTINDLTAATAATGDSVPGYDASAGGDKKFLISEILALGIDDTAYDATSWNGDITKAPSKNAVRDKIASLAQGDISGLTTADSPQFAAVNTVKTTVSAGVSIANEMRYTGAPAASAYPFTFIGNLTLNGSTSVSSGEHGVAIAGVATDTSTNDHSMYGLEGKVDARGTADSYAANVAVATYQNASAFSGTLYGYSITQLGITTDGSTPLAQGTAIGYHAPSIIGGTNKFSFYGYNDVFSRAKVGALDSTGADQVYLSHDGADGSVTTNAGHLTLAPNSGLVSVIGVLAQGGVLTPTISSTDTLTNKRITARTTTITSSATPTINTDNCDAVTITALGAAITSMTTNLSGTPANFDQLMFRIKDDGTGRAITWGASFAARGAALPTTTTAGKVLTALFLWNSVTSTWDCIATANES